MNKQYKKWFGDVELTKELLILLTIGGCYSLSVALSNTFVNIYLWKQSGKFMDLAIYNLMVVIFQPLTFILAGKWAKKVDRIMVLRMGVSFLALFYLSVLFFGERAHEFLAILGALLGVGYGFYWLAYNVLTFEITEPETRDFFNGFLGTLSSAGGMVGPVLAGSIISRFESFVGYSIIFAVSLGLFTIAVLLSLMLKRRPAHGQYFLKRIWKERKTNQNWNRITIAHFFQGLREGVFVFVISVFVFISTGSEFSLGTYGLVNSGISFIGYSLASRLIKQEFRKPVILAAGVVLYLSLFLIVFHPTFPKLLIYASMIAIAYPFLLVPYISITYDVIGRSWKASEMRVEYIVVRELFNNAGRIFSVLCFIFAIHFFPEQKSIPILLLIVGAGHTLIYFCIRNIRIE
ncbi:MULTISPECIES: MFS transporter [Bacillus]|jgi:YQGE family putative transporter|uniref:MFS transporter n=1 Tax=Bacillus TaxID=1386 RepID=UPI0022E70FC2|nr:MFS transporter [Bacillus smithii]MED0659152.1 MFS transporter [Bacillus smithii]